MLALAAFVVAATASLFDRASTWLKTRSARKSQRAKVVLSAAANIRRFILTASALSAFTIAAATFDVRLGWAVGGLCALYLEQSMSDD